MAIEIVEMTGTGIVLSRTDLREKLARLLALLGEQDEAGEDFFRHDELRDLRRDLLKALRR